MQEFSSFEELAGGRRRKRQGNKADMERRGPGECLMRKSEAQRLKPGEIAA